MISLFICNSRITINGEGIRNRLHFYKEEILFVLSQKSYFFSCLYRLTMDAPILINLSGEISQEQKYASRFNQILAFIQKRRVLYRAIVNAIPFSSTAAEACMYTKVHF